jgi:hypothetical protein
MANEEKQGMAILWLFQWGEPIFEGASGRPSEGLPGSTLRRHRVQLFRHLCLISMNSRTANWAARDSRNELPIRHGDDATSQHFTISKEQAAGPNYLSSSDIKLRIGEMAIGSDFLAQLHQPPPRHVFVAADRMRGSGDRFWAVGQRIAGGDRPLLKNQGLRGLIDVFQWCY